MLEVEVYFILNGYYLRKIVKISGFLQKAFSRAIIVELNSVQ